MTMSLFFKALLIKSQALRDAFCDTFCAAIVFVNVLVLYMKPGNPTRALTVSLETPPYAIVR